MSSQTMTADMFGDGESHSHFRGWVIFAGVAMLALGTAAVIYAGTATIASVVFVGTLLALAGAIQIVHAFQVRTWKGFFLYLLDGVLRAALGVLLIAYPGSSAEALTLVLSFYFIGAGVFKSGAFAVLRFPGWGWGVVSGLVTMTLGILLATQWPASGMWFIGLAVGIDLIVSGWTLLMFAAAIRQVTDALA